MLLSKKNRLDEQDKKYIQRLFDSRIEQVNTMYKIGEKTRCLKCGSIKHSNRYCENCIREKLKAEFENWTSGNKIIDDFIQQCQLDFSVPRKIIEWIPFDDLYNVFYLSEGRFSKVHFAKWKKGYINDWDENKREFIRPGTQNVILKSLKNSGELGTDFLKKVIFINLKNLFDLSIISYF